MTHLQHEKFPQNLMAYRIKELHYFMKYELQYG